MEEQVSRSRRPWGVGTIMLGVVVVLVVGLLIQRSRSADGEQVPAFHIGEAGVHYVLHLLNSGTCTPSELVNQHPLVQRVPSLETGEPLGTFVATFLMLQPENPSRLQAIILGHEAAAEGSCQRIEATLESFSGILGTKYRVLTWDTGEATCGDLPEERSLSCKGARKQ